MAADDMYNAYRQPDDLDEYQRLAATTAIYPKIVKLIYPVLGLTNEAGEVAGKLKKFLRDEQLAQLQVDLADALTSDQRDALIAELGDVLWYLAATATDLGVPLSEIAERNLDKLFSRKERGVLGGSGDNR